MARVDIVRVDTPEGNAVRGGDPVTVGVTVYPARDWFKDTEYLVIEFIYAEYLEIATDIAVYLNDITIDNSTEITFKVNAEVGASIGDYYVQIKNTHLKEIVISGPEDGVITVS
jgi:hypothetical protein